MMQNIIIFYWTGFDSADSKASSTKNSIYELATTTETWDPIADHFSLFVEVSPIAEVGDLRQVSNISTIL